MRIGEQLPSRCIMEVQEIFEFVDHFDVGRQYYLSEFLRNFFLENKNHEDYIISVVDDVSREVLCDIDFFSKIFETKKNSC